MFIIIALGAISCRREGCPTFNHKTGEFKSPKGNKREPNILFEKKIKSPQKR